MIDLCQRNRKQIWSHITSKHVAVKGHLQLIEPIMEEVIVSCLASSKEAKGCHQEGVYNRHCCHVDKTPNSHHVGVLKLKNRQ